MTLTHFRVPERIKQLVAAVCDRRCQCLANESSARFHPHGGHRRAAPGAPRSATGTSRTLGLVSACLLLSAAASAIEKNPPQLLFLGDSVHGAIVQAAAKELGDRVRVHYPPGGSVHDSGTALAQIDRLLGDKPWDIIYFNFGIGELFYKDPATREIRIMSKDGGGVRVSTPAQYEERLDALVLRLKASGAKLIWGNTTPMATVHFFPSYQGNLFDADAEQEYNAIAARVMAKHKVPVLDLHGHVMTQFKAEETHPPYTQYAKEMERRGHPLHAPLVRALLATARGR